MIKITLFFISIFGFILSGFSQENEDKFVWPEGKKIAISLSYDDALDSQLDNAIPALDKLNLKASFYLLPNSPTVNNRMEEWRNAAKNGHELGNHSMYHPCRKSLPNRSWVPLHHDLDKYSITQMVEELTTANTFLKAIDGKNERTFTPPCGDHLAGNEDYISKVKELFIATKGQETPKGFSVLWAPQEIKGSKLIAYLKNVPAETLLINIIFHGIGGDYLSISSEAHIELLNFLAANEKIYYVDSYINIMRYAKQQKD